MYSKQTTFQTNIINAFIDDMKLLKSGSEKMNAIN